jgi:phosphate transport system protein
MTDLRRSFHESLESLDARLTMLFSFVSNGIDTIRTSGPLADNREVLDALCAQDRRIDVVVAEIEELVQWQLARQQAVGRDLRLLVTALRIAPELERSHDLVVHVAEVLPAIAATVPRVRATITQMVDAVAGMWRAAAASYETRDVLAAARLDADDALVDELHQRLLASVSTDELDYRAALDIALAGRFLERLGDHAVHLAARVRFLALGDGAAAAAPLVTPLQ